MIDALAEPTPAPVLDLPPAPTAIFSSVIGPAGTGKTFLVRTWTENNAEAALCATTGIAAINLGGTTLNALLGYFDTASLRDAYITGKLHAKLRRNRDAGLKWYVCDEMSMLSGDQLTYLTRAILDVNRPTPMEIAVGKPHDPVRLTLVGDFAQLPPINEPFAFESEYWPHYAAAQTTLSVIRRQADRDFIEALQAVRRGDAQRALQYFGGRFHSAPFMKFDGTTLKAKNEDVDRFNFVRLEQLQGKPVVFFKRTEGQPRGEWKQIPEHLHLKIGALVMILANKRRPPSMTFDYVNGDLGTLVDVQGDTAYVQLSRAEDGDAVEVTPVAREHLRPCDAARRHELRDTGQVDKIKGRYEVAGTVSYTPLRAAYATTVHKSQGLSLDQVQIDIRNHFFSHPHMLYVALSRARTPQGLRLVGTPELFKRRCSLDSKVLPYVGLA